MKLAPVRLLWKWEPFLSGGSKLSSYGALKWTVEPGIRIIN